MGSLRAVNFPRYIMGNEVMSRVILQMFLLGAQRQNDGTMGSYNSKVKSKIISLSD